MPTKAQKNDVFSPHGIQYKKATFDQDDIEGPSYKLIPQYYLDFNKENSSNHVFNLTIKLFKFNWIDKLKGKKEYILDSFETKIKKHCNFLLLRVIGKP